MEFWRNLGGFSLSPEMGTIALAGVAYAEKVNFRCDASAAKQSV